MTLRCFDIACMSGIIYHLPPDVLNRLGGTLPVALSIVSATRSIWSSVTMGFLPSRLYEQVISLLPSAVVRSYRFFFLGPAGLGPSESSSTSTLSVDFFPDRFFAGIMTIESSATMSSPRAKSFISSSSLGTRPLPDGLEVSDVRRLPFFGDAFLDAVTVGGIHSSSSSSPTSSSIEPSDSIKSCSAAIFFTGRMDFPLLASGEGLLSAGNDRSSSSVSACSFIIWSAWNIVNQLHICLLDTSAYQASFNALFVLFFLRNVRHRGWLLYRTCK